MSEQPMGPGWWRASDQRWYPPEQWTGPPGSTPPTAARPDQVPGGGAQTDTRTRGQRYSGSLSAVLPDGWFAKESITLLAPDGQANVIASTEPLDPTINTAAYAETQGQLLEKEFPGYRQQSFERVAIFGDQDGFRRRFTWSPPDGVPVYQVQLYMTRAGRGYTATATTPATNQQRYDAVLHTILDSLRVGSRG